LNSLKAEQKRMKVTEKDVRYVEDLANLELSDAERTRMIKDLNSILEHIDQLNGLDTGSVEPMAQTSERFGVDETKTGSARFAYALREDVTRPSLPHDEALAAAPNGDGIFFRVPKVIEK
jgi:aspartyl-tRNA(Asn)/glutamyl-tRNA(Gln) amidotransferase subunit C